MTGFCQQLENGAWLTVERARAYSMILLALGALIFAGWIAMSDGLIDRNGKPIGTDFSNVYAAEIAAFDGRDVPFFGWHHPRFFFGIASGASEHSPAWHRCGARLYRFHHIHPHSHA